MTTLRRRRNVGQCLYWLCAWLLLLGRISVLRAAYCYRRSSLVCSSVSLSRSWALQNGWTDRDAVWNVDSGWSKEACIRWGAHWRHLANTIEPSMCRGDAAFCQIILSTCYYVYYDIIYNTWSSRRNMPKNMLQCRADKESHFVTHDPSDPSLNWPTWPMTWPPWLTSYDYCLLPCTFTERQITKVKVSHCKNFLNPCRLRYNFVDGLTSLFSTNTAISETTSKTRNRLSERQRFRKIAEVQRG